MNTSIPRLQHLFQSIPVYGFGTLFQMETIRLEYINILGQLSRQKEHKEFATELITKAIAIGLSIKRANKAKDKKTCEGYFNHASNSLGIDLESLIWHLGKGAIPKEINAALFTARTMN